MERVFADIRYAARVLIKRPLFTIVAVVTLALGIGANTAIFSVVNAVVLSPLPFHEPDRLVVIWSRQAQSSATELPISYPDYVDYKEQSRSFEQMAALRMAPVNLTDGNEPERITGARVTANFLSTLGIRPILGRDFREEEAQPGAAPVALMGYDLWQQRFGASPDILDKPLSVDGKSYAIIGILPKGFSYPVADMNLYMPFIAAKSEEARGSRFLRVTGRLKAGVSLAEAQAEMDTISARLAEQYQASNTQWTTRLLPLHEQIVGKARPALMILLGAVACVLLIACANVANLLLARSTARRTEFAIRTALGAKRSSLIRQLLTESLLLSTTGGLLGLLLAMWGVPILTGISAASIPRVESVAVSGKVLLFTLGVSLVTGILFGIAPALGASSKQLTDNLKEGRKGSTGGVLHRRLLNLLVVAEVAIAIVLLAAAGLMIRSFMSISGVETGFNPKGVVSMNVSITQPDYADIKSQAIFYQRLFRKVSAINGVESVSADNRPPMVGGNNSTSFNLQSKPVPPGNTPTADCRVVGPDYFKTLGIPLLNGREFRESDDEKARDVVVINQSLAEQYFGAENPVGQYIEIYPPEPKRWREVVGVVGNVRLVGLDSGINPTIYVPIDQNPYPAPMRSGHLLVRSSLDTATLVAAIKNELKTIDAGVPIAQVKSMEVVIADSLAQRRLSMSLLAVFAGLAAILAAVGIYGVMAYSVAARTHEIGVRMALGASSASVLRMVLLNAAKLTGAGIIVGLVAAIGLTRVMASLLYGVSATDPITLAVTSTLLASVALAASYLPARKAASVDPMLALRYD
jgi:putative ABC transport system permease protein